MRLGLRKARQKLQRQVRARKLEVRVRDCSRDWGALGDLGVRCQGSNGFHTIMLRAEDSQSDEVYVCEFAAASAEHMG